MDLLTVQGTLKSLLQHHSSKASILWCSAFFTVQLSHPYMTTGKTIALTRWTFIGKVMSLLFNMLSRLVITFLPRSKRLLISWLQSPSAVILEPKKIKSDTVSTVRYSHLFQNFPQFIVIHTVKGFGIVNKAEIDVFLELSCFFDDPVDVGNLTSASSAFSKTSLNIWKFSLRIAEVWLGEF